MILIILPFPLLSPLKIGAFTFGTERLDGLVEWTFSLFDTDESGAISVAEFIKMAELMGLSARKTEKLQPFLDRDRSGKITMSEFRKAEDAAADETAAAMAAAAAAAGEGPHDTPDAAGLVMLKELVQLLPIVYERVHQAKITALHTRQNLQNARETLWPSE